MQLNIWQAKERKRQGTLAGDSDENVTLKVNLRCFKLHRSYSISVNLSNVVKFNWLLILKADCV